MAIDPASIGVLPGTTSAPKLSDAPVGECVPPTIPESAPKEKIYKMTTCTKCRKDAIYFPQFSRVLCPDCNDLPTYEDTENATLDQYIPARTKEALAVKDKESKLGIIFRDPRSDPMYGLPGRNEKCVCGSGAKFKKCCLPKMEAVRDDEITKAAIAKRDVFVTTTANSLKLVNVVYNHFKANPGLRSVPITEVKFRAFANSSGALADEVDTSKTVVDSDTSVIAPSGKQETYDLTVGGQQ